MFRRVLLALALAACFAAPASAQVSQSAPFVTAPGTYKSVDATNYSGADMCAKIAAAATALNTLAPAGGIIDARGFAGTQHCTTSPFAGWPSTNSWPVKLIMGAVDQTDVPVVDPDADNCHQRFRVQRSLFRRGIRGRVPDLDFLSEWRDFDAFSECRGGRGQRHRHLGDRLRVRATSFG